jgi:hypothetical protein
VARCANLPIDIRNGEGVGGGRVVGWLPIVSKVIKVKQKLIYLFKFLSQMKILTRKEKHHMLISKGLFGMNPLITF